MDKAYVAGHWAGMALMGLSAAMSVLPYGWAHLTAAAITAAFTAIYGYNAYDLHKNPDVPHQEPPSVPPVP